MEAALTVTAALPLELSVSGCVTVVFWATVPNEMLIALTAKVAVLVVTVAVADFVVSCADTALINAEPTTDGVNTTAVPELTLVALSLPVLAVKLTWLL